MKLERNSRGSALLLVIIFVSILTTIGMATLYMNGMEEIATRSEIDKSRAFCMAEAGVERAVSWMRGSGQFPELLFNVNPINPFGGEVILEPLPASSPGRFSVCIDTSSAAKNSFDKQYVITSTGMAGSYIKVITVRVNMANRMRFVYYTDKEYPMGSLLPLSKTEVLYFTTADTLKGAVYSRDRIGILDPPVFGMSVSSSVSSYVGYYDFYSGNQDGSKWGIQTTPNDFDLFGSSWAKDMARLAQHATVVVGDGATVVLDGDKVKVNGSSYPSGSDTDVVVFVNGDLTLRGTAGSGLKDIRVTIVASQNGLNEGNIYIDNTSGSILYDVDSPGLLGLVASNNLIVKNGSSKTLTLNALILAKNALQIEDHDTVFMGDSGTLTIYGGLVQSYKEPLGTIKAAYGASKLDSGYEKYFEYDPRLQYILPPYFPCAFYISKIFWNEKPVERQ